MSSSYSLFRLILAAICAIPPLLLQLCLLPIMLLLSIPLGYFLLVNDPSTKKIKKTATTSSSSSTASSSSPAPPPQLQRQIIVIGGSTGIGYAIATAAALDASPHNTTRIVIVARNVSKLQVAQQALTNIIQEKKKSTGSGTPFSSNTTTTTTTTTIEMVSADVTDPSAITKAAQEIMTSTNTTAASTITHLFLCVGEAQPRHHAEITPEQYHQATLMNQLGTIYTTNAFLPYLKNRLPSPTVATNTKAAAAATFTTTGAYSTMTYTCSMGGQCGVYGYTSYTPTKFALRGYVESLHMELYADNNNSSNDNDHSNSTTRPVYVQIAYPPDTDTPGFSRENVHKPTLTHLISAVAGLALPESVGTTMYRAATTSAPQLRYQIYFNFDGFLLCTLASGFTPVTTWMDAVFQMTIMNFVRIIALFYLNDWHRIILKYHRTNPTTTNKDPLYGSTTSAPRSKDDTVANTATTKTSSISNESTKID